MVISRQLGQWIEKTLQTRLPLGLDPIYDIISAVKGYQPDLILDIGANIGQSIPGFVAHFPDVLIHCFEPVTGTFDQLKKKAAGNANIHCHRVALGARAYTTCLEIDIKARSTMNSLVHPNKTMDPSGYRLEDITVSTLDLFCSGKGIGRVGYCKIDTEGFDWEVLKGGSEMIRRQAIDFVEVEVSMNSGNNRHVPLEDVKAWMEARKYFLFGVYEQKHEWINPQSRLRRANILFVSESRSLII
jgi:FkbM family methyltransferase